jgi:hypothetical protein
MVQTNCSRRVVARDGQHSRSISANGHARRRTWSRLAPRVQVLVVTGALELEGVVGHGRGLCASSLLSMLSLILRTALGRRSLLGQMGCIKKHTRHSGGFGTNIFIVDNFYSEDKSDYYLIEMLLLDITLAALTDGCLWLMQHVIMQCFMQPHTKIFFLP